MSNVVALPALPNVADARLPATYEAAQKAIADCERLDECKSWSDRAAALASYARQAKDDSLRVMAIRIQARAERRCGELLKQIPSASGGDRGGPTGGRPPVGSTRTQVAKSAGLTEHRRKTALRVASIPAEDFERQIERPTPPSITRLAEQGTVSHAPSADVVARCPDPARAARAFKTFSAFATFCEENDPLQLAKAFGQQDTESLRGFVVALDSWLDRFVSNLEEG
jgi:hypothetical protein